MNASERDRLKEGRQCGPSVKKGATKKLALRQRRREERREKRERKREKERERERENRIQRGKESWEVDKPNARRESGKNDENAQVKGRGTATATQEMEGRGTQGVR